MYSIYHYIQKTYQPLHFDILKIFSGKARSVLSVLWLIFRSPIESLDIWSTNHDPPEIAKVAGVITADYGTHFPIEDSSELFEYTRKPYSFVSIAIRCALKTKVTGKITLLNRLYGGFLFLNVCTAVSEDHRKWKLAWLSIWHLYHHIMSFSAFYGMFVDVMPLFNHCSYILIKFWRLIGENAVLRDKM